MLRPLLVGRPLVELVDRAVWNDGVSDGDGLGPRDDTGDKGRD
jgi:hypothetical protein